MAGAPWNILDNTGRRVAICHGNDLNGDPTHEDEQLAAFIVACVNASPRAQGLATNPELSAEAPDDARFTLPSKEVDRFLASLTRACSECGVPATLCADLDIGPSTDRRYICDEHAEAFEEQGYDLTQLNKEAPHD